MWILSLFNRFCDWWAPSRKVYDVKSLEFHEKAREVTGYEWDFSRLGENYRCCVKNCFWGRLWGHWTCEKHITDEKKYFYPIGRDGGLFWSHQ